MVWGKEATSTHGAVPVELNMARSGVLRRFFDDTNHLQAPNNDTRPDMGAVGLRRGQEGWLTFFSLLSFDFWAGERRGSLSRGKIEGIVSWYFR